MDDPFGSSGAEAPPPYLGAQQPPGISERMQALMSRAEQEIQEQRQLQALVNEVRQSLTQIQDEIRQAAGAHTLEVVRGEVTGLGAEVRGTATMIGERLEAVVRAVGASAQVMQGVGQHLDRITELLNHQQQQINALSAAVTQQRDTIGALPETLASRVTAATGELRTDVTAVRDAVAGQVSGVRDSVGSVRDSVGSIAGGLGDVRADVGALRARVDGVVGELRDDSATQLRGLAERIDAAVLALAEALLRPRAGGDDVPTSATMTVPVVPVGWGAGDDSPAAEDGAPDADVTTEEAAPDAATDVPEAAPAAEVSDDGGTADTEPSGWDRATEPPQPPDAPDAATDGTDDATDAVPEAAPEPDAPADSPPADEPADAPADTPPAGPPFADADLDAVAGADEEVPLDSWPDDGPAAPAPPTDSTWGWDQPPQPHQQHEHDDDDSREKRRPWWRPGG